MKKIIVLIIINLILISCGKDFLEEEPRSFMTADVALSSEKGLEAALGPLYDYPRAFYNFVTNGVFSLGGTDVTIHGPKDSEQAMVLYNNALNSRDDMVTLFWERSYKYLNIANNIINSSQEIEFEDEKKKNGILAEARMWRAYILFYLVQRYGNIYLSSEPTDEINTDVIPSSDEEVYQVITDDLLFAVDNLSYDIKQPGRFSKGAAEHLLSNVYLVLKDWEKAAQYAESLINNGPFNLVEDYADLWDWSVDNANDLSENIFVLQFEEVPSGGDRNFMHPLFTPEYDRVKGVKRTFEQGSRPFARMYPSEYLINLFSIEDERLDGAYKLYWFFDDEANLPDGVNLGDTVKPEHTSNPILQIHPASKKYWDGATRSLSRVIGFKDVIIFRLAETYLFAAEAHMEMGNSDKALEYINEVRRRAFNDQEHDFETLNEEMLLEERARELAFEMKRWFTLKRRGKLVENVRKYNPQAGPNIKDYHVNLPIPQVQIDFSENYPQNEGYF